MDKLTNEIPKELTCHAWSAQNFFNWLLIGIGVFATLFLVFYIWRYVRLSNRAGRMSEFDERTFKKIIEKELQEDSTQPFCQNCKIPMTKEVHYKEQVNGVFTKSRLFFTA